MSTTQNPADAHLRGGAAIRIVQNPSVAPVAGNEPSESERVMQMVAEAADEQKARDIVVLDVRGQTIVSDFFIMCSGTSTTHIQAIAEGVQDKLREWAQLRAKPEGNAASFWMVLDYGDVILHVFDEGTREFYDLERLWADAKITKWPADGEATPPPPATQDATGS
jgi:ribosome-associated protein